MSLCPRCGKLAHHVPVTVPWRADSSIMVDHFCDSCDFQWSERAQDPAAALTAALDAHGLRVEAS